MFPPQKKTGLPTDPKKILRRFRKQDIFFLPYKLQQFFRVSAFFFGFHGKIFKMPLLRCVFTVLCNSVNPNLNLGHIN